MVASPEDRAAATGAMMANAGGVAERPVTPAVAGGRMKDLPCRAGELEKSFKSAGQP